MHSLIALLPTFTSIR